MKRSLISLDEKNMIFSFYRHALILTSYKVRVLCGIDYLFYIFRIFQWKKLCTISVKKMNHKKKKKILQSNEQIS